MIVLVWQSLVFEHLKKVLLERWKKLRMEANFVEIWYYSNASKSERYINLGSSNFFHVMIKFRFSHFAY